MNQRNQEKPSLILMLAPIPIVLLGYHYLFHWNLTSDLTAARKQETELLERTNDFEGERSKLLGQLKTAKKELSGAKQQTELAAIELADAEAQKAELRDMLVGGVDRRADGVVQANPSVPAKAASGDPSEASPSTSMIGQFANMFTSTLSMQQGAEPRDERDVEGGKCSQMSSLCSVLDSHQLKRLENSEPQSSKTLVAAERTELEKLLDTKLPPNSDYRVELEGKFTDLMDALHELNERLPAVSILSVSLDTVDIQTQRYVWMLEVGIRG